MSANYLAAGELESNASHSRSFEARGRDDNHAVDARFDRRYADGARGQFHFAVDAHARFRRPGFRAVAVLLVEGAISELEPDVGAGRGRHPYLARSQRGNRTILP